MMLYLYEFTKSGGKTYRFYSESQVLEMAKQNNLEDSDHYGSMDERHENESTKILIFVMRKK